MAICNINNAPCNKCKHDWMICTSRRLENDMEDATEMKSKTLLYSYENACADWNRNPTIQNNYDKMNNFRKEILRRMEVCERYEKTTCSTNTTAGNTYTVGESIVIPNNDIRICEESSPVKQKRRQLYENKNVILEHRYGTKEYCVSFYDDNGNFIEERIIKPSK